MIESKVCSRCNKELLLSEFNKDQSKKDGLQVWCRTCQAEYKKLWKKENPDKVKHEKKKYRIAHPEAFKKWVENNKEYFKQYMKEYYGDSEKRSVILTRNRKWKKENRDKVKLNKRQRKAKERGVINTLTPEQWLKILEMQNNRCAICDKKFTRKNKPTMDHIIPLSHGYGLTFENTRAVCHSCYASKSNKIVPELIISWIEKPEHCASVSAANGGAV